ncbi:MAG: formylglycine-generating enzyme family protein [Victivallales bacterium]|nr:formylglycine-generating enzyme family protein [Victivallales bacterium]
MIRKHSFTCLGCLGWLVALVLCFVALGICAEAGISDEVLGGLICGTIVLYTVSFFIWLFQKKRYCVIDLSGGHSARRYPCRFTNTVPNVSDDCCRTTELWLRRIPAGSFRMGSPASEPKRDDDERKHMVCLTQAFFLGIFPCTQRQYELVCGSNPSKFAGEDCPVEEVSYDDLRGTQKGSQWPSGVEVDAESFFGRLQAKTGLAFDLPTEAQWEYACRAGTTTAFHFGNTLNGGKANCDGRFPYGTSVDGPYLAKTCRVGNYAPNAWGLYDMHGNVDEWCLDWWDAYPKAATRNPVGATSGSGRVYRGGCWSYYAQCCRSACRADHDPSYRNRYGGFRVALHHS